MKNTLLLNLLLGIEIEGNDGKRKFAYEIRQLLFRFDVLD